VSDKALLSLSGQPYLEPKPKLSTYMDHLTSFSRQFCKAGTSVPLGGHNNTT
jgi:hypothetical protein